MKKHAYSDIAAETVLLRPSLLRRAEQLLLPAVALLVAGLSLYYLLVAEEPSVSVVRSSVWRMVCCGVIFFASLFFLWTGRITFILTPWKIMQKGGWELLYEDIASVTLKRSFLVSRIELVPKGAPNVVFFIPAFSCDRPLEEVTALLKKRCR